MSRLANTFHALRENGEGGLVIFITAGDPDLKTTVQLVLEFARRGVDVVELGIPFSDPLADGPVIQAACQRALRHGVTCADVLQCVERIRRSCEIPIALMTPFNPPLQYGLGAFAADAASAGVDGVLITDLPPEESAPWLAAAGDRVDRIFLLAPTTPESRIELVSEHGSGFAYCISRTGVTGEREDVPADLQDLMTRIRSHTQLPVAVGFGISRPEHVRTVIASCGADAAVVGSAVVRQIGDGRTVGEIGDFAADLKAASRDRGG